MFAKNIMAALLVFFSLASRAEVIEINAGELTRLAARGVPVIDIRTEGEWKDTGVIAGGRLLTFFDESGRANPALWLERVKTVAGPETPVILVCRSGRRSSAAAQFLSGRAGYKTVYNLNSGVGAWLGEGRPTVPPAASMALCGAGSRC